MAIFNCFFLVCQRVGWTGGWNGIPMDTIFSPQKNDRRAPGLRCCYDKSQQQYMSCAGNGGDPHVQGHIMTFVYIYIYIRIPIFYYVNYRYTAPDRIMEKKKRFNLQAPPVYDRNVTNLFWFHNYVFHNYFFLSIILSVTVCPSIRNFNAF